MGPRAFARGDQGLRQRPSTDRTGFNGAASFRPRRFRKAHQTAADAKAASMGPRAFARGDPAGKYQLAKAWLSFNGAASFRPRRF